ncbi:phosphate ABC transporter substrate-binding protein [Wolbachia pipientis]|uniref:Phosphate ABC transporter substrate-binding protein n=1 Tax=Wolbachia pipientis TaxID=955 RepID=A0A1E7QKU8_WOLPI|nr:substrate-binding domain-containing protein [Wolbachia pipientis]OEY87102.1 phosphate ABC transporter substrate-binding protein [Wolbachia pipientis]
MINFKNFLLSLVLVIISTPLLSAGTREYVRIIGSSTVNHFISFIADEFNRSSSLKAPIVESIGSGAGFKMFCSGIEENAPDITTSSRPIRKAEIELCQRNKVGEIIEVVIGYDGVVIANSKQSDKYDFTKKDLFDALSAYTQQGNKLVKNNKKYWSDISKIFKKSKIEIYGPYQNTGTYDTLIDFIMLDQYSCMNARIFKETYKDIEERKKACSNIRNDEVYKEVGTNENIIIHKLNNDKDALGILSFSFLIRNQDKIQGSTIAGIAPTYENISSMKYLLARPLYLYIKKSHVGVVRSLKEFINEVMYAIDYKSGYLFRYGLIPLSNQDMQKALATVHSIM